MPGPALWLGAGAVPGVSLLDAAKRLSFSPPSHFVGSGFWVRGVEMLGWLFVGRACPCWVGMGEASTDGKACGWWGGMVGRLFTGV